MIKRTLGCLGLALIACACMAGCDLGDVGTDAGPTVTDSRSVKQGGAKSVAVELDMNVGDMKVTGGAGDLMNADFRYNVPGWKPDVQYNVSGTQGTLVVRQPDVRSLAFKHGENRWDVRLRDVLPMDLKVRCETGDSNLDVNGLALNSLAVTAETGDATVNLAGRYARLKTVNITGETGDCDVKMTGDYPSLNSVKVTGETGDVTADLSGHWRQNADAEVGSETGSVTVTVPTDVGVYITTHKETGDVHANGLNAQGNIYTNAAYGKSPITLRLNVHVETGDITLRTAK